MNSGAEKEKEVPDNYIFDLDEDVARSPVSYKNRFGITNAADLYRPKDFDESQERPAVVIGPPYSGVKEQGPGIYAQNLAKRGFVALAVDYLGTRAFVDQERIGTIGMCGSGAFALSAAQVDRASRRSSPSPWSTSRAWPRKARWTRSLTRPAAKSSTSWAEQRYADFKAGRPALGPRGAPIGFDENTDPIGREFGEFYSTPRGYHPNSITQFTLTSRLTEFFSTNLAGDPDLAVAGATLDG
jgi:uncharacterized protein